MSDDERYTVQFPFETAEETRANDAIERAALLKSDEEANELARVAILNDDFQLAHAIADHTGWWLDVQIMKVLAIHTELERHRAEWVAE